MILPTWLWPFLAALCAGAALWSALGLWLHRPSGSVALRDYLAPLSAPTATAPFGSPRHRIRLAFHRFGLNVAGREALAVWLARLTCAVLAALSVMALGFPWLVAVGSAVLGSFAVQALLTAAWRQEQLALERELPAFLAGLALTVQAVPHWTQAVETVASTLADGGPLRAWLTRLLARVQVEGRSALDELLPEAQTISSALGLTVFELQRLADTGGAGYGEAFILAADSLGVVLEARAVAAAKGESARGAIVVVLGAVAFTLITLAGSAAFRASFTRPVIQAIYLGAGGLAAFGAHWMNAVVDDALA